jgi:hypothetical protein
MTAVFEPQPVEWVLGDPIDPSSISIRKCFGYRLPKEPMWKVKRAAYEGVVLSKGGVWVHEPTPSSRDYDFYINCRYETFDHALQAAIAAMKAEEKA